MHFLSEIKSFSLCLVITARPYWVKKLESVDAGERDTAEFHCQATGIPEPDHFWFINGTPIASEIFYNFVTNIGIPLDLQMQLSTMK